VFLLKPLLFKLDPEAAHQLTLRLLQLGGLKPFQLILRALYSAPQKPVSAFGLTFPNPVGLAAGYDKDGRALRGLAALGFGHLEIGTVTPGPQPGNARPRVFRLSEDEGVINRLGFPSRGAAQVVENVQSFNRKNLVLGINLGKNKETSLEEASGDYLVLMNRFMALANYLTINISSPNTEGLQRLQGRAMLESLLAVIARGRANIASGQGGNAPILVKLSPDLSDEELEDAVGVILDQGMDGIIVTNTTRARQGLRSAYQREEGGLSGSPLKVRSEAVLRQVVKLVNDKLPIVSVGGIMSPEDAKRRLDMGARLIQIYTGLIYRGPGLTRAIVRSL
jgi:dihydroorotate dehydrogenase